MLKIVSFSASTGLPQKVGKVVPLVKSRQHINLNQLVHPDFVVVALNVDGVEDPPGVSPRPDSVP